MTTKTIFQRLADFQSEVPAITKRADNPFYNSKYATFDRIQSAIKPILAKYGLFYMQSIDNNILITTVYTVDGEKLESGAYPLVITGKPQDIGSAVSYAKRYSLVAFLGLIVEDEDDDGNKAQAQTEKPNWITDTIIDSDIFQKTIEKWKYNNKSFDDFIKGARTKYAISKVNLEKIKEIYNKI